MPTIVVITGGRDFVPSVDDELELRVALAYLRPTEVRHGACRGADLWAAKIAESAGCRVVSYPADWKRLGKKAGPMRNTTMLTDADFLLAFPGGRGTANAVSEAQRMEVCVLTRENGFFGGADPLHDTPLAALVEELLRRGWTKELMFKVVDPNTERHVDCLVPPADLEFVARTGQPRGSA